MTTSLADIRGCTVLVVGATRGLGFSLVQHLSKGNNKVIATARTSDKSKNADLIALSIPVIGNIELENNDCGEKLIRGLKDLPNGLGSKIDYAFLVAGYFTTEAPYPKTFEKLNIVEERKMIEICALSPLAIVQSLVLNGNLQSGSKVILVTSEGGSIGLRTEKEGGANYGHHMSKTAANMMGRLLAWDIKPKGIAVQMQHPGFLRTDMTKHYSHLYDELGAVDASVAVPYIVSAAANLTLDTTGKFIAAMGSKGLGLGIWAIPEPDKLVPGGELPW